VLLKLLKNSLYILSKEETGISKDAALLLEMACMKDLNGLTKMSEKNDDAFIFYSNYRS